MLDNIFAAIRVPRIGLILGFAVAVPAFTLVDRTAAARESIDAPVAVTSTGSTEAAEVKTAVAEVKTVAAKATAFDTAAWTESDLGGIDRDVFELALNAANAAVKRGDADAPATLTVIDFSRPSTEERLWVYDLRSRDVLFTELVSHGRGSGLTRATAFSNTPESYQSSIGLYRTAETYTGKHGYSLRLDGLDRGFNDRARERAIVMHSASYVSPSFAKTQGYLGRSHGCPALRPEISRELIDTVKGGSLVFAYYPDQDWLRSSEYLN